MVSVKLKQAREQAGFSQEQLSKLAGLGRAQISKLECDKLSLDHVHWSTIRRLCNVLHLTPNELMEYHPE